MLELLYVFMFMILLAIATVLWAALCLMTLRYIYQQIEPVERGFTVIGEYIVRAAAAAYRRMRHVPSSKM